MILSLPFLQLPDQSIAYDYLFLVSGLEIVEQGNFIGLFD